MPPPTATPDNDGNRRVTFKTLSIAGTSWNVAFNQPGTVLAGAAAEWHVDLPAGQGGPALRINGETGRGEQVRRPCLRHEMPLAPTYIRLFPLRHWVGTLLMLAAGGAAAGELPARVAADAILADLR